MQVEFTDEEGGEGQMVTLNSYATEDGLESLPAMAVPRPPLVTRQLTQTSAKYDRQGKGFLDSTELALRNIDSENKGYLDIDKVYVIMQSLQDEQKRSGRLIEALQREQQKGLNMKKGLIVLSCFAALLALSNIATSFAAAWLARDMQVQSGTNDLSTLQGERVATTNKLVEVFVMPVSNATRRHRHLQAAEYFVCGRASSSSSGSSSASSSSLVSCQLQGQINYNDAKALYQKFCPQWRPGGHWDYKCSGGVTEVLLGCNNKFSLIQGGTALPSSVPAESANYTVFPADPTKGGSYVAVQSVFSPPSISKPYAQPCQQTFSISMWCPNDNTQQCFVFSAYQPNSCTGQVQVCGPAPSIKS